MSAPLTPMAFVHAILAAYRRYGRDPSLALERARIAPVDLARPGVRISAEQMEELSAAAMRELDDEALGWWQRRLPWGTYGMLARASLTAPDLRIALKRWARHHQLVCEDVNIVMEASGRSVASLTIVERSAMAPEVRELCLVTLLRNVHGYASWLIDSRISLASASFPYPAPPHADVYPRMFACPIAFDAPQARLCFDPAYLDLPVRRDERAARAMLARALPLTVHLYRRDRVLKKRVQQVLAGTRAKTLSADDVASALNISTRTLFRQLNEEGVSLQSLKDNERRAAAEDMLTRTRRPIKQIALALGFSNAKSFARAFQTWTGSTPAALRRRSSDGSGSGSRRSSASARAGRPSEEGG